MEFKKKNAQLILTAVIPKEHLYYRNNKDPESLPYFFLYFKILILIYFLNWVKEDADWFGFDLINACIPLIVHVGSSLRVVDELEDKWEKSSTLAIFLHIQNHLFDLAMW